MKIDANNCETATAKSQQLREQQQELEQQQQQLKQTANTTSCNNNNSNNDTSKNTAAATATKTTKATYTKMTDERNINNHTSNNNNNNNINNNNNNSSSSNEIDVIKNNSNIIEAAKILLKNGLNGTTTSAAATLLTAAAAAAAAAATVNLPPPLPPPPPTSLSTQLSTSTIAPSDLLPAYSTAVVAATSISSSINNGQSPKSTTNPQQRSASTTKSKKAMAAATATATTNEFLSTTERRISGTPPSSNVGAGSGNGDDIKIDNGGVIDYTVNANSSANTLNLSGSSTGGKTKNTSSNDIGRHPISSTGQGFGGRLQFFKDGKFILELARSKDGEKGGWVSVPRKLFRAPLSATSSTITPTSTSSTTYPKNESSTSLSFSDDNSSIQSSPWQRDHCWKQSAPRYGISKEMSLYYQRSKQLTLTTIGLQVSRKKRRRPYDNMSMSSCASLFIQPGHKYERLSALVQSKEKPSTSDRESDTKAGKIDPENNSEDETCSTSSTSTLTGTDCIDGVVTANKSPKTNSETADQLIVDSTKSNESANTSNESSNKTPVEPMNTSEDERVGDVTMVHSSEEKEDQQCSKHLNGDTKQLDKASVTPPPTSSAVSSQEEVVALNAGAGEKRLKKLKTRAKLITIIQKLIDRVPTAIHSYMSKTPQHLTMSGNSGGATYNQTNSMMHKISPPSSSSSSAATSRLVELQYHQQHVSPRKRILREFEKVSLEDTGPTAVGGKRCRAKGSNSTASGAKSSPQRVQSIGCAVPTSSTASTITTSTSTNGGLNKQPSKSSAAAVSTSSMPTRLYSSYSIHSLLGGGTSSSSTATSGKQAIISNINYQQHQQSQQQHNFTDPSYLRAMLASPQSPENNGTGGKSPSSNAVNKKRSPPYSSPLYDNHSRSPTVSAHIMNDYGRRSPRATPPESNYKIRFGADHITPATSSANQLQQQQQQQSFYSPYMMSPKYVPAPQTSMSPNSISNANASRSPRHSSAFSAHIPSLANASASANSIPTRELSPPRSATASPRETTPRTVPKKTASIRRQFASPNNVASPNERTDEQQHQQHERKAHLTNNSSGTAQHQHSYQRASPNPHAGHMSAAAAAAAAAAASPLHYYMYGPNTTGSSSSNAVGSTSVGSTSAAAQANAAAAGAYIPTVMPPSYYHPYISTLAALRHNPMWMHHYPGTTAGVMPPHNQVSSQTASRLSSPFHSFPYNGVGAAAVAAAAAAANAFGGAIPQSHLSQIGLAHQMSAPSAMHHHAPTAGAYAGVATHSPKLTDENSINTTTKQTTALSLYPSSIKDEHSSDVPLNLSKH